MTVLEQRLRAVELRLESNVTLLEEIHGEVIGNRSARSSLRERVSANEADIATLQKHIPTWRTRAFQTGIQTMLAILAGYFGVHIPIPPHPG